jgi:hypothetical protein
MSTQPPTSKAVSPLAPVYPFNEPGQPIVLHDGLVGGLAPDDAPGVVELSCVPNLNIVWRIGENSVLGGSSDSVTLVLRRPDGDAPVPSVWRGIDDGWSNGAAIGKADAPLKRIVTHWFNLPNFRGPITLTRTTEVGVSWWQDGGGSRWADGRSRLTSDPTMLGSGRTCTRLTST